MRILYVVPWLFGRPLNTSSEYHVELIGALAKRKHKIIVVCFSPEPEELNYLKSEYVSLHPLKESLSRPVSLPSLWHSLRRGVPISIFRYENQQFHKKIQGILGSPERPNVALLEHIEIASYSTLIREAGLPVLLQLIDIETQKLDLIAKTSSSLLIKIGAWLESKRMFKYELETVRSNNTVCLSDFDRDFILKYLPYAEVDVIPLAINLEKYIYDPCHNKNGKIVFIGPADYYKNAIGVRWFLNNVYGHVLDLWPDARFRVVNVHRGSTMDRYIKKYPHTETIEFVENLHDEIRNASVTIAPMQIASGVSGRVISSLALGSPVVATTLACQGLAVKSDEHLRIADEPIDFARDVVNLAKMKPSHQSEILDRGRLYIERNHDINRVAEMIEKWFYHYVRESS